MRTLVFKPSGRGPFPLVIVNHGSHEDPRERAVRDISPFIPITNWFTRRGYVVALLERPGHGETGGPYVESQGDCDAPDFASAGLAAAAAIRSALDYLQGLNFVQKKKAIVVGHSAGGWGALALASQRPDDVSAIIVFAAGRGGRAYGRANSNCRPDRLIEAAAQFGTTTEAPSLWIYSENDSYFDPALAQRIFNAFGAAGAKAQFHLLPAVNEDGHFLAFSAEQVEIWGRLVDGFLSYYRIESGH